MPKVSIIIPCYNLGPYLKEAVDSCLAQTFQDFEIVIVDDGSTDTATQRILASFQAPRTKIIRTPNQGLSAARNTGIENSSGEYILPLDADDKIAPTYLEKAVHVLDQNPGVSLVYCQALRFGGKHGRFRLPPFSMPEMLTHNLIFASAFFRRADYDRTSGYDAKLRQGWEDWDFWLSLLTLGGRVHQIRETLFFYRFRKNSMEKRLSHDERVKIRHYLYLKHAKLYEKYFGVLSDDFFQISDSREYKLGKLLLKPFRMLKNFLTGPATRPEKAHPARLPCVEPEGTYRIHYFDLGMHEGQEIDLFLEQIRDVGFIGDVQIIGVDANPAFYEAARKKFRDTSAIRFTFYNLAIASQAGKIRFYQHPLAQGSSIYPDKNGVTQEFLEIEASPLSEILKAFPPKDERTINILKANIEGAEWDMLLDLEKNNLLNYFDIYLGSTAGCFNDISKIASLAKNGAVEKARRILKKAGIEILKFSYILTVPNVDLRALIAQIAVKREIAKI